MPLCSLLSQHLTLSSWGLLGNRTHVFNRFRLSVPQSSNRSPPAEPIGPLAKQAQPIVMPDPVMKAILIGELDIFCCTLLFAMFASRGDLFFISGAPEQQERWPPEIVSQSAWKIWKPCGQSSGWRGISSTLHEST